MASESGPSESSSPYLTQVMRECERWLTTGCRDDAPVHHHFYYLLKHVERWQLQKDFETFYDRHGLGNTDALYQFRYSWFMARSRWPTLKMAGYNVSYKGNRSYCQQNELSDSSDAGSADSGIGNEEKL